MKKAWVAVLTVVMILGFSQVVWAASQDFTVVNATGKTIDRLFVAHASENDWGDDILGRDTMSHGEYWDITFTGYSSSHCSFDLRVEMTDGSITEWDNLNLCNIRKITLKPNRIADLN
ncbi:MAG: hypothetical protein HQK55_14015 [Deltaproteobacteria bacterium]|nr:hypothetical protein [Deltaproteobacteria bacterium]